MSQIKKEKKQDVLKFETVSFDGKVFTGGFSDSMDMLSLDDGHGNGSNAGYCKGNGSTNNCNGGNCVAGCGAK